MTLRASPARHRSCAFTLIELLVVVAIIALLISILLPSLNRARAQARATLCASRISQMVKSVLLYCEDYDETPPFTSKIRDDDAWEGISQHNMETWLGSFPDMTQVVDKSYNQPGPYPEDDVDIPRSGTLFKYARFENLYRCPDFTRQAYAEQLHFNYTRSVWCRWYRMPTVPGAAWRSVIQLGGTKYIFGDMAGPIMRPSMVHSTSRLAMFLDEQWNRHIAGAWANDNPEAWNVCDPVFDAVDEIGQYHDPKARGRLLPPCILPPVKQGSLAYYDGHVELCRDPGPSESEDTRDANVTVLEYFATFYELAYAQQGRPLEDLLVKR